MSVIHGHGRASGAVCFFSLRPKLNVFFVVDVVTVVSAPGYPLYHAVAFMHNEHLLLAAA